MTEIKFIRKEKRYKFKYDILKQKPIRINQIKKQQKSSKKINLFNTL